MFAASRISARLLEIEAQARSFRKEIFEAVWGKRLPQDVMDVFEPGRALNYLNYSIRSVHEIGRFWINGTKSEVAGTIEQKQKIVTIAEKNFSYVSKRFTAAHELAHAILHPDMPILHRDVPLERAGVVQDWREVEANRFASAYLMPCKLVHMRFEECFGTERFELSEATAFALCGTCAGEVQRLYRSPRQLSLALAGTTQFSDRYFKSSLCEQFRVSASVMAIRLEELGIVGSV